jgi:hypothetical protein
LVHEKLHTVSKIWKAVRIREPGSTNSPRHHAACVPSAPYACGEIRFSAVELIGFGILHTGFDFGLQCCFGLLEALGLVLVEFPNG